MISEASINNVKSLPIVEVLSKYMTIQKKGASHIACCPLHNEKTPSFHISMPKNTFKCFGCGEGGNAIDFVMKLKGYSFYESVELLANDNNVNLDYENSTIPPEVRQQKKQEKQTAFSLIQDAASAYQSHLKEASSDAKKAWYYLRSRGILDISIKMHGIGYAPSDFNFITSREKFKSDEAQKIGIEIGILAEKNGKIFNTLIDRITFPINNEQGAVVGFGARVLDPNSTYSKYVNSTQSSIYNKSATLYGLDKARKSIQDTGIAFLVEGYMDVVMMHQATWTNTVGSCGTALTELQAKNLKKYCGTVFVMRDSDKAGQKATLKDIEILVATGFVVKVIILPAGMDPADCFQPNTFNDVYDNLSNQILKPKDGVEYFLDHIQATEFSEAEFIDKSKKFLSTIANETYQIISRKACSKEREVDLKLLTSTIDKKKVEREEYMIYDEDDMNKRLANYKWMTGEKKNELLNYHFTSCDDPRYPDYGYWFMEKGYNIQKLTNFVLKPLFTINDQDKKCEIIEISNRRGAYSLEMPQGCFTSIQKFEGQIWQARCILEGNFGTGHLRTLNSKFIHEFKEATVINNLGMQPEGFWSFADKVWYDGELIDYDKYGMVEVGKKIFYSPGAAEHNKSKRLDEQGNEFTQGNIYRNDKFFEYKKASITFSDWSKQMVLVFQEKAMNSISHVIFSLFKDIINQYEKTVLLYGYGNVEAGKSAWAEREFYLFFDSKAEPFNLNTGTEFAFFETFSRFYCMPFLFNEFDEDKIDEKFFRGFKQAYDNEGRNKGMGVGNKTTTQQMNIAPIMIGQTLTTKDGGSVLTRVIPEKFLAKQFTDEEKENFSVLQKWEKQGINSVILEVLAHRKLFKEKFKVTFNEVLSKLKKDIRQQGEVFKERIACNHAVMLTCAKIIGAKIELGFHYDTYYAYQLESVVSLTKLVTESDNLGQFWRIVEYLLERSEISDGYDFRIDVESKIRVNRLVAGKKEDMEFSFEKPTKILCLRLTTVFPLFQREMKMGTGNKSVNQKTLETYFESNAAFIGVNPSRRFSRGEKQTVTSSYIFDYEKLGINLDRTGDAEDLRKKETITGKVCTEISWLPIGDLNVAKFSILHYTQEGFPAKTITHFVNCYAPQSICPDDLKMNDFIKVEGLMAIEKKTDKEYRQLDILNFISAEIPAIKMDDAPF